jgi:hypothetical protein
VLAALGAPGRELQRGVGVHADDRERVALAFVRQAQDRGVEPEALVAIPHHQDQVVERHRALRYGRAAGW